MKQNTWIHVVDSLPGWMADGVARRLRRPLGPDQFWPDQIPVVGAQIPAPEFVFKITLNPHAFGWFEAAAPGQALIKGLLIHPSLVGQALPLSGCDLLAHSVMIAIR